MEQNSRTREASEQAGRCSIFYASIHGIGGVLRGHVPIFEGKAGYFEPLSTLDSEYLDALARDGDA